MNHDTPVDVRTVLATSAQSRVEVGADGVMHVLAGPVTLHLERAVCEELTTTLARALVRLVEAEALAARSAPPPLTLVWANPDLVNDVPPPSRRADESR